jgi:hypothetical protein
MPTSTAPFKACIGCMHLGSQKVVEGGGKRPICMLLVNNRFVSECPFNPERDQERKAAVAPRG